MTVRKVKGGYKAFSHTKGALSKKPKSKAGAHAQHRAASRGKKGGCSK